MSDIITKPYHYTAGEIECKAAMKSMMAESKFTNYQDKWRASAFEYLWRADKKDGVKDLYKAIESIQNVIDDIESMQAPKGVLTER